MFLINIPDRVPNTSMVTCHTCGNDVDVSMSSTELVYEGGLVWVRNTVCNECRDKLWVDAPG